LILGIEMKLYLQLAKMFRNAGIMLGLVSGAFLVATTDVLTGLTFGFLFAILFPAFMSLFLIIAGRNNRVTTSEEI